MEEELQKRNTDCVYFLASPLTCKKGLECEYRHSEIARLNPRDCWYWLAGSCLNPSCAFRHPPLESSKEASSEPAPLPSQFSTPGNKTNVPCYFYFNGFCNKGDRCSFLHASSLKSSSKTGSAIPDALPVENKLPARLDSPQTAPISAGGEDHFQQNENNGFAQSLSPSGPPSGSEEIPIGGREVEDFIPGGSDRGSEGHLDTCIEPEERWESSPGFDVLVGDKSENMGGYEDDPDRDSEGGDLNCRYLTRDYEDVNGYEPTYSDDAVLFERGAYTSYDGFDNGHPRRTPSPFLSRKRKLSPSRRGGIDLRDHLRKHRAADRGRRAADYSPRRFDPSRLVGRIKQRPRQSVVQRLGRRLGSEIESSNFMERNEALFARASQSGKVHFRHLQMKNLEQDEAAPWKRRSGEEHASFTGPKSLAEIKEQKRRARESGECYDNMGNSSNAEEDFQGPKPLSEILKGKSRTNSAQNGDMSSC